MGVPFIKGPIRVGTTWKVNKLEAKITGINVDITTPAGEFNTIEIQFKKDDVVYKEYYAKDIGVVRIKTEKDKLDLVKVEYPE